ncbi:MAG: T9SS type A sorting domain-containing protein, partial [Saprospiraceae bacterium]|nr:T9SS type A sorting domain-containing protein [Saprospiraceae bacterium]
SATHQPVFLNAEVEDSNKINLQWNPYSGREVDHYEIFLLQENGPDIFVDSVDSGMNNFNDLNAPRGLLKYYIKIVFSEAISCHQEDDTKPSVISNVVSLLNIRPVISQVNYPIQVFPNPTRGEITLGGTTLADVRVFDVTGGEILFFESVRRVDLQNLNSGIYYLRITTNDRIYTERIAKI